MLNRRDVFARGRYSASPAAKLVSVLAARGEKSAQFGQNGGAGLPVPA